MISPNISIFLLFCLNPSFTHSVILIDISDIIASLDVDAAGLVFVDLSTLLVVESVRSTARLAVIPLTSSLRSSLNSFTKSSTFPPPLIALSRMVLLIDGFDALWLYSGLTPKVPIATVPNLLMSRASQVTLKLFDSVS